MAMSPMMQEYCKTKEQYKDCILFYRLGDFYEMFFDDALLVTADEYGVVMGGFLVNIAAGNEKATSPKTLL